VIFDEKIVVTYKVSRPTSEVGDVRLSLKPWLKKNSRNFLVNREMREKFHELRPPNANF
jgi:hypothetical protein